MDWLLLVGIIAILIVPYAHILSTVISEAYFRAKLKYQQAVVTNLQTMAKSGVNHGEGRS